MSLKIWTPQEKMEEPVYLKLEYDCFGNIVVVAGNEKIGWDSIFAFTKSGESCRLGITDSMKNKLPFKLDSFDRIIVSGCL